MDIFTSRLPEKTRAMLNLITHCVFFLPVFSCLTYYVFQYAFTSTMQHEVNSTSWAPPIYPFKVIMAVCFFFLLLQGISNLIKYLLIVFEKEEVQS